MMSNLKEQQKKITTAITELNKEKSEFNNLKKQLEQCIAYFKSDNSHGGAAITPSEQEYLDTLSNDLRKAHLLIFEKNEQILKDKEAFKKIAQPVQKRITESKAFTQMLEGAFVDGNEQQIDAGIIEDYLKKCDELLTNFEFDRVPYDEEHKTIQQLKKWRTKLQNKKAAISKENEDKREEEGLEKYKMLLQELEQIFTEGNTEHAEYSQLEKTYKTCLEYIDELQNLGVLSDKPAAILKELKKYPLQLEQLLQERQIENERVKNINDLARDVAELIKYKPKLEEIAARRKKGLDYSELKATIKDQAAWKKDVEETKRIATKIEALLKRDGLTKEQQTALEEMNNIIKNILQAEKEHKAALSESLVKVTDASCDVDGPYKDIKITHKDWQEISTDFVSKIQEWCGDMQSVIHDEFKDVIEKDGKESNNSSIILSVFVSVLRDLSGAKALKIGLTIVGALGKVILKHKKKQISLQDFSVEWANAINNIGSEVDFLLNLFEEIKKDLIQQCGDTLTKEAVEKQLILELKSKSLLSKQEILDAVNKSWFESNKFQFDVRLKYNTVYKKWYLTSATASGLANGLKTTLESLKKKYGKDYLIEKLDNTITINIDADLIAEPTDHFENVYDYAVITRRKGTKEWKFTGTEKQASRNPAYTISSMDVYNSWLKGGPRPTLGDIKAK